MANVSINNITETWSSSGTTYTGIKYNVTDTASATGSKLIDLQVGGVSKFGVGKDGSLAISSLFGDFTTLSGSSNGLTISNRTTASNGFSLSWNGGLRLGSDANIGIGATPNTADVFVTRDASNTLAQRNGTNAQSYRIYLSYIDATNNSRFAINATANYYRLASEIGTSTGSKKPIVTDIYQSTVDPTTTDIPDGTSTVWKNTTSGVVKLWANNGGTLIGVALA